MMQELFFFVILEIGDMKA